MNEDEVKNEEVNKDVHDESGALADEAIIKKYPEKAFMEQRELKLSEILSLAWKIFTQRPGAFVLAALMFFFPVSFVLSYLNAQMPDLSGITDYEALALAYAEAMYPYYLWSIGLSFFTLLGSLSIIQIAYSELYEKEKKDFGSALFRAFRRFPAAASAYLLLIVSLITVALFTSVLTMVIPMFAVLIAIFLIIYLIYFAMMRESTAVVALHTGLGLWRNTACVNMLFKERLRRIFGTFLVLGLITQLPKVLLSLLSGFGLEMLENPTLRLVLDAVSDSVLSVFGLFLTVCVTVIVNNYGDMQNRKIKEMADKSIKNC